MIDFTSIEPLGIKGAAIVVLCSLLIGLERQWSGKPAGIRTSILICLSAYVFVSIGQFLQPEGGAVRIVGQIVTGVGFLGGGVIIAREGLVLGVTSAAVIWVLAAIGSLIGLGYFSSSILITIITLFVLVGITLLEKLFLKLNRGVHKKINHKDDDEGEKTPFDDNE
ncbi:MAG: MgtC/SapB family protein [Vicingus serpentipes]|nr:MgtC/SapB family protein [Vicingus serpentipes]